MGVLLGHIWFGLRQIAHSREGSPTGPTRTVSLRDKGPEASAHNHTQSYPSAKREGRSRAWLPCPALLRGKALKASPSASGREKCFSPAGALHEDRMLSLLHGGRRGWKVRQLLGQGRGGPGHQPCPDSQRSAPPKDWCVGFCNFPVSGKARIQNPGSLTPKGCALNHHQVPPSAFSFDS